MQTSEAQQDHQNHLNTLLSKLRPFQRKAFDFAVNGVIPDEDGKRQKTPRHSGHQNHVAGAGTGRILLGDEMGLGEFEGHLSLSLFFAR